MSKVRLITFRVENQFLAIPIDKVKEVIRNVTIFPSPQWTGLLHGIINLRGMVIPILDLRRILSKQKAENTRRTRIILVEMLDRTAGLIVDQVNDIVPLTKEQMVPLSSIALENKTATLVGVAKLEEQLYLVLDVDQLIHDEEHKLFKDICLRLKTEVDALN